MSQQRVDRIAGEVRAVVGDVLARQEIKDPRVRGAGLITVTHVRISGDLRLGRVLFTVHGAGEAELVRVREGLDHASGFLRRAVGDRLRLKVTPHLSFEIDRVFDQASRVEALLREVATAAAPAATSAPPDAASDTASDTPSETPAQAAAGDDPSPTTNVPSTSPGSDDE